MNQRTRLTLLLTVDAKASAKPAVDAGIDGVAMITRAVTPTTALDKRLKRADSQRFTFEHIVSTLQCQVCILLTSPHPVVGVGILRSTINTSVQE